MTENTKKQVPREQKLFKLRLRRACAWLVGLIYFASGVLKIIDPTGAGLVMEEYFKFFHMDLFTPAAKTAGIAFAFLETSLGIALLTGVWRKIMAISIVALHTFFTILTSLLLIFNPSMDCGCFGEAIHLTHFETFIKNIIILLLLLVAYVPFKRFGSTKKRKYVSFSIMIFCMTFLMIWSLTHLPVVDFTAFKSSTTIMAADKNAEADDLYESLFVYEKNGIEQEFDLDNLPDSSWTFINTITRRKRQDGSAPVLSFYDKDGDYNDEIAAKGKVMIISLYNPILNENKWKDIDYKMSMIKDAGITPLLLISEERGKSNISEEIQKHWPNNIFNSDFKTLISLNRANGGLTFLSDGYIVSKFTARYQIDRQLKRLKEANPETLMTEASFKGSILLQTLLLVCIVMILFV